MVLLVTVWVIEINWLQSFTLISESGWTVSDYSQAVTFRLSITIMFCLALVMLIPRMLLIPCFLVLLVFTQAAWFYHSYFEQALSWTVIRTLYKEGSESVTLDKAFILPWVLAGSIAFLLVKLGLLYLCHRKPIRWRWRLPIGTLMVGAYIASILVFNFYGNTRLRSLKNWMSFDRVGVAQGYVVTWVGESIYVNNETLLRKALESRKQRDDRIMPIEGRLDLPGHLVLLQVESLDWSVLGLERNGVEITPNLNALRETSMLFQLEAIHRNGSADADFVMLHACAPGPSVVTYKITGYPHEESLPRLTRAAGYPLTFIHGNRGRFYSRIDAFRLMDFERTIFVKEMVRDFDLERQKWGAVPDDEVLMLSADLLDQAETPQVHLIVTYTSHTPFVIMPEDATPMLANDEDNVGVRYLNSIHYTDQAIGDYLARLPEGTTVVIYADHEGGAKYPERIREHGTPELIPGFVYRVGEDLSLRQRSRDMPKAMNATWSLIDLASWVHHWFDPVDTDDPVEVDVSVQGDDVPSP